MAGVTERASTSGVPPPGTGTITRMVYPDSSVQEQARDAGNDGRDRDRKMLQLILLIRSISVRAKRS